MLSGRLSCTLCHCRFWSLPPPPTATPLRDHNLPEVPTVLKHTDPDLLTVVPPADTARSGWPLAALPVASPAPRQPSCSRRSRDWRSGPGSAPPRSCHRPEPESPGRSAPNRWVRGRTMNRPMSPVLSSSMLPPFSTRGFWLVCGSVCIGGRGAA